MAGLSAINPTLERILGSFRLDIEYVRGEGNYLYDKKGRSYLDFIAQYGAVPFGYNPPFVWEALNKVSKEGIPSFVQPSTPVVAVRLAEKLARLAPGDLKYVTFAQSGTEAVEAAIKLARSATGRPIIISTHNSFHGKTLASLSATGKDMYQKPFFAPAPGFIRIPFNDAAALREAVLAHEGQVAAFIVEPVQGEGGIRVAKPGYLRECQEICRQNGVLFIVDEVQTGLGRTGYLFACERENITPDIMVLAKALGGGMVPIGACLSGDRAWNDDFGHYHSSTFANNNLTCAVGEAVLDELLKDDGRIIREAGEKGDYLLKRCREIADRYPGVVKEVRGQGLMVGFEFKETVGSDAYDLAFMVNHEGFCALLAGYLLNVHGIRVAPYLNNSMTLRLEPPLTITYAEIDRVMEALDTICRALEYRDYGALYGYLLGDDSIRRPTDYRHQSHPVKASALRPGEKPDRRFAFIIHYPSPWDLAKNNPSFSQFSREELEQIMEWETLNPGAEVVCHLPAIRSAHGEVAEGWLIAVPYGGRQMKEKPRDEVVDSILKGVDLARDLGADIVGLGAYTSVVTRGGRDCLGRGVAVTSGNSFTIVMAMEALWKGAELMEIDPDTAKGAVVGATGSIGRVCAILMAERMKEIVLLGNPEHAVSSRNRLKSLTLDIMAHACELKTKGENRGLAGWLAELEDKLTAAQAGHLWENLTAVLSGEGETKGYETLIAACEEAGLSCPVTMSLDADEVLPGCDLIVAASSSPDYLIFPHHLKPGAVVCDVARPEDVAPEVYETRDDVLLIEGGLVSFPDEVRFGPNMGYREGIGLACLSETMLLCLEGDFNDYSIGQKIPLSTVSYLRELADKHGFKLAALRSSDRELTLEEIERIKANAR